jgi:hypothetical protein
MYLVNCAGRFFKSIGVTTYLKSPLSMVGLGYQVVRGTVLQPHFTWLHLTLSGTVCIHDTSLAAPLIFSLDALLRLNWRHFVGLNIGSIQKLRFAPTALITSKAILQKSVLIGST